VSTAELRASFWGEFAARLAQRPDMALGPFRHVHGNDAYVEFDEKLGQGFRPRAVFLLKDNQLRAEVLTTSRSGLEALDRLVAGGGRVATVHGGIAEASVSFGRSDGKLQFVWREAVTSNRRLWPVHHDWIGESLLDLRATLATLISQDEPRP